MIELGKKDKSVRKELKNGIMGVQGWTRWAITRNAMWGSAQCEGEDEG
jgi:hypothetical protein